MTSDTRMVYGSSCSWWDVVSQAASTASGLPCCPHCGGVLMEMPSIQDWWESVDLFIAQDPDQRANYKTFVGWLQGRDCGGKKLHSRAAEFEAVTGLSLDGALP